LRLSGPAAGTGRWGEAQSLSHGLDPSLIAEIGAPRHGSQEQISPTPPSPQRKNRPVLPSLFSARYQLALADERFGHKVAADQVLLNDLFQHRRVAAAVPRAFGIDDRDWPALADAQAVGLGPQHAAVVAQAQLLEPHPPSLDPALSRTK